MTIAHTSQVEENVAFDPNKLTQTQKWKLITKLDSRTELQDGTSAISVAQQSCYHGNRPIVWYPANLEYWPQLPK